MIALLFLKWPYVKSIIKLVAVGFFFILNRNPATTCNQSLRDRRLAGISPG